MAVQLLKIYSSNFKVLRRRFIRISENMRKPNPINIFRRSPSEESRGENPLWKLKKLENTSYLPYVELISPLLFARRGKHMLFHCRAVSKHF